MAKAKQKNVSVKIPADVQAVLEDIAFCVHDEWARGRVADGWTYGAERNDALKQTPCLVPYHDLPESEKAYDRNTALAVIRALLSAGFTIEKRGA